MNVVLASKDFLAGTLYMSFGLLGLWLGRGPESGAAGGMGAGYFPRLVCALLIAIGAVLAMLSLMQAGERLERGKWRPFVFVTLSCLALGLVLTLALTTVLARLADGNVRAIPLLLLCALLIVINVGIFVVGLRVAIALWPAGL